MKAKKGNSATLRAKALKTLQKLARIAAADDNGYAKCVSCGRTDHYKNMDGGHFIPKGSSSRWALEEQNVHPQCKGCNGFGMKHGSAEAQYTIWMLDWYGKEAVANMLATKKEPVKYYAADYREMIDDWGQQIMAHERRIGERGR
jgi:hypothetical protein